MILESVSGLREFLDTRGPGLPSPAFHGVLMVSPEHFRVEYAINPHMKTADGGLQQVDTARAAAQWEELRGLYARLGYVVHVLPAQPELPDMVFAANQSFPFWDAGHRRPAVLMSRMRSEFRRPEVAHFRKWYESQGYLVHELENQTLSFEGNGDALLDRRNALARPLVWGGYGPRTSRETYLELSRRLGIAVVPLALTREDFYHLDTCFSILDEKTVVYQPEAFTPESRQLIAAGFPRAIALDLPENMRGFSGNCHCPGGRDVIIQRGNPRAVALLSQAGFSVHEVDTSEFIKSGGSVFCLKMMVF